MASLQEQEILFWNTKLADLEHLVVSGQHDLCLQKLEEIPTQKIPRQMAPKIAELASRIQHSIYALKVLYRFVYPENSFEEPARDSEKLIYAYALSNLGAEEEALQLLETVDAAKEPEVHFRKALAYVKQWNYAKTIPVLKEFIQSDKITPYRKLVGEVNLAAAYIAQFEFEKADLLLKNILSTCQKNKYTLLLGNSYELQAQSFFFQKRYDEALDNLNSSLNCLKEQKGIYLFFVEKWIALCQCFKNPSEENLNRIQLLKDESFKKSYWDTAREFDLFHGILLNSEDHIRKVIMGTPSEAYRQRVRKLFDTSIWSYGEFKLKLGPPSCNTEQIFDPYKVEKDGSSLSEKPHLLSLFEALTLDFYRPHYLGAIFKIVYPQERFNPTTSPPRVMRLLIRLDRWFKQQGLPLFIHFKKSEFALHSSLPISIVIQRGKKLSTTDIKWNAIKDVFEGRSFSAAKISKAMGISKSSSLRLISQALADGSITKVGNNRGTEYRFKSRTKRAKAA